MKRKTPTSKRQYAAILKMAKARTYTLAAEYIERWPNKSPLELAEELRILSRNAENDAVQADGGAAVDLDGMIGDVLGDVDL